MCYLGRLLQNEPWVGGWPTRMHPPRTNVQVRVDSKLLVHQSVFLLVARFPIHDVTFSFFVGQGNGGNLERRKDPHETELWKEGDSKQGWARGGRKRVAEMENGGASRVQTTRAHCLHGIYKPPSLKISLCFWAEGVVSGTTMLTRSINEALG